MTRALLCALLLLTACQKKDPEGTIQPEADGGLMLREVKAGDSAPFRLNGGDLAVNVMPEEDDAELLHMSKCNVAMKLMTYGSETGREIPISSSIISATRMNGVTGGVYFIRTTVDQQNCEYLVDFSPYK